MLFYFGLWISCWLFYLNGLCESKDLCLYPVKSEIIDSTFASHIPRGKEAAGKYALNKNSKDVYSCVHSCCRRQNCNVVFFHQNQCFHITCDPFKPKLCDPVSMSDDPTYQKSVMIKLRDSTSKLSTHSSGDSNDREPPVREPRSCIINPLIADNQCPENEVCGELFDPSSFNTQELFKHLTGLSTQNFNKKRDKRGAFDELLNGRQGSVVDDNDDDDNYSQDERTVLGVCRCRPGYIRKEDYCIPDQSSNTTESPLNSNSSVSTPTKASSLLNVVSRYSTLKSNNESAIDQKTNLDHQSNTSDNVNPPEEALNSIRLKRNAEESAMSEASSVSLTSPSTISPQTTYSKKLFVSAGENKTVRLPNDRVVLQAKIIPTPADYSAYLFEWTVIEYPKDATGAETYGKNKRTLTLSKLTAGNYTLMVKVKGPDSEGSAVVGVTVNAIERKNVPPTAVISPSYQQVRVPNPVSLDGSKSSDDQKIVKYDWVDVESPMQSAKIKGSESSLELNNLTPGNYTIKLTVTDSDGATNSATAKLNVLPEEDNPPVIKMLESVIVHLPVNSVVLNASKSFDDKNITSYKWTNVGKTGAFDVAGSTTPVLKLSKLEEGEYKWKLEITDSGGHVVSKTVVIYVKPKKNMPPNANPGPPRRVPIDKISVILDGSNSSDDSQITKYLWEQIKNPDSKSTQKPNQKTTSKQKYLLTLKNSDTAKVTVTNLKLGHYVLKLTVWDKEMLNNSATVTLDVVQSENKKPIAKAGGHTEVILPQSVVQLDGSQSHDDHPNMTFSWTRVETSLAWGRVLSGSDHSSTLLLTDLMPGDYSFKLTVNNSHGLTASDVATLTVKEDPNRLNYLELHFNSEPGVFTQSNKESLLNQLKLILHKSYPDDLQITETRLDRDYSSGDMVLIFYATVGKDKNERVLPGSDVLNELTDRIITGKELLEFTITELDTVECQNNCSGHGHCDTRTKSCLCDKYWMQSPFRRSYGDRRSNCDWSIVYVVLICILLLATFCLVFWFFCRCRRRGKCRRNRVKKQGYSLLNHYEERDDHSEKLLKSKRANGTHSNSILETDSELSSDEETLFVNRKVIANGDYRDPSSIALEQISLANT